MIYKILFLNAGVPQSGLTPTITLYKKVSDGTDVSSPPSITGIGGGGYKFIATPSEDLYFEIDGGASLSDLDRYKTGVIGPSDAYVDAAVSTRALEAGGNLAVVKAKTDLIPANPAIEGNVQSHVAAALTAYDPPTRTEATADKQAILDALGALGGVTVGDLLAGDLSDSLSFPAHSLADLIRKLFWVICNKMVINDTTGAFTAYKTDGVTPGMTGTISDDGSNTARNII